MATIILCPSCGKPLEDENNRICKECGSSLPKNLLEKSNEIYLLLQEASDFLGNTEYHDVKISIGTGLQQRLIAYQEKLERENNAGDFEDYDWLEKQAGQEIHKATRKVETHIENMKIKKDENEKREKQEAIEKDEREKREEAERLEREAKEKIEREKREKQEAIEKDEREKREEAERLEREAKELAAKKVAVFKPLWWTLGISTGIILLYVVLHLCGVAPSKTAIGIMWLVFKIVFAVGILALWFVANETTNIPEFILNSILLLLLVALPVLGIMALINLIPAVHLSGVISKFWFVIQIAYLVPATITVIYWLKEYFPYFYFNDYDDKVILVFILLLVAFIVLGELTLLSSGDFWKPLKIALISAGGVNALTFIVGLISLPSNKKANT